MQPGMLYAESAATGALARLIESHWWFAMVDGAAPIADHRPPPDGLCAITAIMVGGEVVALLLDGPSLVAASVAVMPGPRWCGLRLWPGAAKALFGVVPAPGTSIDLATARPDVAAWLKPALQAGCAADGWPACAALLAPHMAGATLPDPAMAAAAAAICATGGGARIADLAAAAGLSPRQFRQRFAAAAGVAPKQFSAVRRLRTALIGLADGEGLAPAAYLAGYADQPHFSRAVQQHFGRRAGQIAARVKDTAHRFN